jgi:phage terminase large subunit
VAATYCDPAGGQRNGESGRSSIELLREAGIRAYSSRSDISGGLEKIRRALRAGDGSSRLVISPRCVHLIEALQCYHYPAAVSGERAEQPVKDGVYDHPIDALRYFFLNYYKKSAKVRQVRG